MVQSVDRLPFDFEALLRDMIEREASDLHLIAGESPTLRLAGNLIGGPVDRELTGEHTEAVARALLSEDQWEEFVEAGELDFSFSLAELSRFRCNVFRQRGTVALAIRSIPYEIPSFGDLGLPDVVPTLAERPRGLVLVTGPTGSGKSTTLAAMVDKINRERRGHIVTIEDPIEFLHTHKNCLVSQREVGADTESFPNALKYVLRQDPDVVLIGEMRDLETIQSALTIAETGHLALATLHTNSAAESINRIIDVFPAHQQSQVRNQLAFVLEGVITQALLPRADGEGRVPACEVMVGTSAVRSLIREEKEHQIYSAMQTGRKHGMQTLNDSLYDLYMTGAVDLRTCLKVSGDPDELKRKIGGVEGDAEGAGSRAGAGGSRAADGGSSSVTGGRR